MKRRAAASAKQEPRSNRASRGGDQGHWILTDVTPEEKKAILTHCTKHKVTISQFLASLVLQDMNGQKAGKMTPREHTVTITLAPERNARLNLLARLQEKSVADLIEQLLQPSLDNQKPRGSLKTTALRYYLSETDHKKLRRHLKKKGISARNCAALLAVQALAK